MADSNTNKQEQYVDENQLGALGNQDQTSTKANQNQISDQYLYSMKADQNISENQDDQDLADDPGGDYEEVDENDDQYDIQVPHFLCVCQLVTPPRRGVQEYQLG